ncbi:MAG TPA: Hsp70 family protein [Tepidisphaeraceae bacterium]|jgi:molecular chaperone DnaK|nr:Hsp70 family protein [Tepidisphaeraceae bacterium]
MPMLGIDLGTTFSAMAYLDPHGAPTTVPNNEGELTTPSVVLFEKSGDVVVGREARRAALSEPASVAECVKRHMGDEYFPKLINGQMRTPIEVSALILLKLKQDAQKKLGTIDGVVITVPAYFDESRRQATAKAGKLAGLKVLDIINEPTSAALAYAYRSFSKDDIADGAAMRPRTDSQPRIVLVYDLGGGTFDVTLLRIAGKDLTVLATAGDVRLGGRDWDDRVFKYIADQFIHAHGEDPRDNPKSAQALMLTAEETKKILTSRKQASYVVNHAGKSFSGDITREQFDELTQDLLYRSENRCSRVIKQASLVWEQVSEILAVGGSTRMPQVLEMLKRVTGKEANCSLSPDEAVAQGAAIHAAICATRPAAQAPAHPTPARPAPKPLAAPGGGGAPAPGGAVWSPSAQPSHLHKPAAPPGTSPPAKASVPPPPPSVEPARTADAATETSAGVVAYFKHRVVELLRSIRTTNVNAYSLGVVVTRPDNRQRVSILIPHNTALPFSVKRAFGTVKDNQASVTVRVVEGESRDPLECIPVGACSIQHLPPGLKTGSPVEITFTYDNSGRLHVEAVETTSGKWASVAIERKASPPNVKQDRELEIQMTRVKVS